MKKIHCSSWWERTDLATAPCRKSPSRPEDQERAAFAVQTPLGGRLALRPVQRGTQTDGVYPRKAPEWWGTRSQHFKEILRAPLDSGQPDMAAPGGEQEPQGGPSCGGASRLRREMGFPRL